MPIRFLISNLAIYTIFGMSFSTLMPIFAKDILQGTSATQGLLMSAMGVGALAGSFFLASRKNIRGMPTRLVYLCLVYSISLILFSLSGSLPLSMFYMVFIGLTGMMTMATTNTLIQSIASIEMRGRVIALYTMASASTAPLGSILMGSLSSQFGARYTLIICASVFLLWSLYSLKLAPKFIKGVLRMLVISNNTDVYRSKILAPEINIQ